MLSKQTGFYQHFKDTQIKVVAQFVVGQNLKKN